MITLPLLMFFICLRIVCLCQQDSAAFMFQDAVRSLKEFRTIIYVDSAMDFYTPIKKYVKKGSIDGYQDTTKISLKLSKKEIRFLDDQFKIKSHFVWREDMFENSIRDSYDSVNLLVSKLCSLPPAILVMFK